MKRFEIITEADARVLEPADGGAGAGGHITPLAQDTLKERRVTVVREGRATADAATLAPRADIRTVAIASDHTGVALRQALVEYPARARARGARSRHRRTDPVDYPDIAASVAVAVVARGEADAGIVIDGAGIGSAIAANKIDGVRAAMATTETLARYSREHNGANVLTLGATLRHARRGARPSSTTWLTTPMREPRYIRRLAKIRELEDAARRG